MDREDRLTHVKREEMIPEPMTAFQIIDLYSSLSTHFNVPLPEWKILPRIFETVAGCFLHEPKPVILFFLRPTLQTAMHEFMHYLVHCIKNGVAVTEKEELVEIQVQALRKLLEEEGKSNRIWNRWRKREKN